jgi:hypothetical protein
MPREGLGFFSADVQEKAELALRQQERVARHAKGVGDGDFFATKMDSLKAGFGKLAAIDWRSGRTDDRRGLQTALQQLGSACHEAADLLSDTEQPILPKTDWDIEHPNG